MKLHRCDHCLRDIRPDSAGFTTITTRAYDADRVFDFCSTDHAQTWFAAEYPARRLTSDDFRLARMEATKRQRGTECGRCGGILLDESCGWCEQQDIRAENEAAVGQ